MCRSSKKFQCSSASRKFLNCRLSLSRPTACRSFQCSSASRKFLNARRELAAFLQSTVSVLFSEPKIPQFLVNLARKYGFEVSVLFSEPKIPQSRRLRCPRAVLISFSALQRAENSSIADRRIVCADARTFQCSSASRKFLNFTASEIAPVARAFQCSSASRKFLNGAKRLSITVILYHVSVLFSEPKIPQWSR